MNELLDSLERGKDMELKLLEASSSSSSSASPLNSAPRLTPPPAAPPSEGIITRSNSMRSTATSVLPSSAAVGTHRVHTISRRPVGVPPPSCFPSRRPSASAAASPSPGIGVRFVPIPLDEDSAEAALVADGMQHSQGHHQQLSLLLPTDKSGAVIGADADAGMHQQHQQRHRREGSSSTATATGMGMPMLLEEEQTIADAALVSDGMRPSEPMLPPYEPGRGRMLGHGGESNELRLSEYVKGSTRAQDMKNSGNY